jgi:hypothetical protein
MPWTNAKMRTGDQCGDDKCDDMGMGTMNTGMRRMNMGMATTTMNVTTWGWGL